MDVGYLEMILYYLLVVLTLAQISPLFWIMNANCICDFTLTLCGSKIHNFRIDLYELYGCGSFGNHFRLLFVVPSIVQISPIFLG